MCPHRAYQAVLLHIAVDHRSERNKSNFEWMSKYLMSDGMLSFKARPDNSSFERVLVMIGVHLIWYFCTCVVALKSKLSQKHTFVCAPARPNATHSFPCAHHGWRWRCVGSRALLVKPFVVRCYSVEPWRLKTIARTFIFCFPSVCTRLPHNISYLQLATK